MTAVKRSADFKVLDRYVRASCRLCASGVVRQQPYLVTGAMIQQVGPGGTLLLCYVLWEYVVEVTRGTDVGGWVWISFEDVKAALGMGPSKQSKLFEALRQSNLIDCRRSGPHGRRMVKVRCDEVAALLLKGY